MQLNNMFMPQVTQDGLDNLQLKNALAQHLMAANGQTNNGSIAGGLNSMISPLVSAMIQKNYLAKQQQLQKNMAAPQNQMVPGVDMDPQTLNPNVAQA